MIFFFNLRQGVIHWARATDVLTMVTMFTCNLMQGKTPGYIQQPMGRHRPLSVTTRHSKTQVGRVKPEHIHKHFHLLFYRGICSFTRVTVHNTANLQYSIQMSRTVTQNSRSSPVLVFPSLTWPGETWRDSAPCRGTRCALLWRAGERGLLWGIR